MQTAGPAPQFARTVDIRALQAHALSLGLRCRSQSLTAVTPCTIGSINQNCSPSPLGPFPSRWGVAFTKVWRTPATASMATYFEWRAGVPPSGVSYVTAFPWRALATVMGVLVSQAIYMLAKRLLGKPFVGTTVTPGSMANCLVSIAHALIVASASSVTVARATVVTDCTTPYAELAIAFSVGYMAWDAVCMHVTGYQPFVPLLLHHILSGSALAYVVYMRPEAIWLACMLLQSEWTVPLNNAQWYLKWRRDRHRRNTRNSAVDEPMTGGAYQLVKWCLLAMWLYFRLYIFYTYFATPWGDDFKLPDRLLVPVSTTAGVGLFIFNVGGLFQAVLPGIPWSAKAKGKAKAR